MRVVGKGNANILIDYGDSDYLYRCLVRNNKISLNNEFTRANFKYINEYVKQYLNGLDCPLEMTLIPTGLIQSTLTEYIDVFDEEEVVVFKIPNLKPKYFYKVLQSDHFTTVFTVDKVDKVLLEVKPKWVHYSTSYCRNCTHNLLKGRNINYCYSKLINNKLHLRDILSDCKDSLPREFTDDILLYLDEENNVFKVLHNAQKQLSTNKILSLKSEDDVEMELLLLMSIRDVTCFIEWEISSRKKFKVNIVDLDLKPKTKWSHWLKTHLELEYFKEKKYHIET